MKSIQLAQPGERLSILCLGAHSDDIEIGAGATLLGMQERGLRLDVHWCVLSAAGEREMEARASAADFLSAAETAVIEIMAFKDSFFPEQGDAIKCGLWRSKSGSIRILFSPIAEATRTKTTGTSADSLGILSGTIASSSTRSQSGMVIWVNLTCMFRFQPAP